MENELKKIVEAQDAALAIHTVKLREERLALAARNDELEALLEKRRAFVERLEALREEC